MTVTVEVPEGYKFCKGCGAVLPRETGFYRQKKLMRSTGEVRWYPQAACKGCSDASALVRRRLSSGIATSRQGSLPSVASDIVDAAWVEAQVVYRRAGKLHWRASHRDIPTGAELIGAYDKGARFDCVLADLRQ